MKLMNKIRKRFSVKNEDLSPDERDLLQSFERGEWRSVRNLSEEKAIAKRAAAGYLRKHK